MEMNSIKELSNSDLLDNAKLMKFNFDNYMPSNFNDEPELSAKMLRRAELLKCEIQDRLLKLDA